MKWITHYKKDFRNNIYLALPIMAGQLGQVSVNLVDNLMIGRLGAAQLAAASLGISIFALFMVFGMGLAFALPPLVSEADGALKPKNVSRYFKHSLVLNVGYAVLATILLIGFIPLLDHLGQEPEVVPYAKEYMPYTALSMIPMMIFLAYRGFSEGLSATVPPMVAMLAGNVLNVVLNYGLIFGKLGMPAYGIEGAAMASFYSRIFMVLSLLYLLSRNQKLWNYLAACNFKKYQKNIFSKVLKLGGPTSFQMLFEVTAFSAAALIMGLINKNAQAAHQIAINLASVTFMICTGMAIAATIRVGNQLGNKDYQKMKDAGISNIIQVTGFMAVFSIIFVFLRFFLPSLYIDNQEVIDIAAYLLIFAAIFQIPDGIQVTALSALRGLQDVKVPTMINFVAYFLIGIPISYFAAITYGMGPAGVWLGLLVGLSIAAVLLTRRFHLLCNAFIQDEK